MKYNDIIVPDTIKPELIVSAFENKMDWDKVTDFTWEMKEKMLSHDFPPILGFPSIVDENDIGKSFLSGNEITEEHLGMLVWNVTDGHHRANAAIFSNIPYICVELDYSTITSEKDLKQWTN